MAIDFNAIEAQMASNIGTGMATGVNSSIANLNVPAAALAAVYTWNGTTTVNTPNTGEVAVGNSIRLDSDGNWFRITAITPNTSVTIVSDYGATIPSGATQSSVTTVPLPAAASPSSMESSLGAAIAAAVRTALETFASDAEISGVDAGGDTVGPGVIS